MKISDIVALAKAGYTPKQVKELIELAEASPKDPEPKVEDKKEPESEVKKPEDGAKAKTDDPIQSLIDILKEE